MGRSLKGVVCAEADVHILNEWMELLKSMMKVDEYPLNSVRYLGVHGKMGADMTS